MSNEEKSKIDRRTFLRMAAIAIPAPFVLAACANEQTSQPSTTPQSTAAPAVQPTTAPVAAAPAATAAPPATQVLAPTPECGDDDDEVTPQQTEGPYFTPNSPERTSLREADMNGTNLTVAGTVLTTNCQPLVGALVDFWHADDAGEYDNVGYRLRGHQFTDAAGRYSFETIVPGLYPGRTRHIHVKVQAPNQPILTTQLYFPNEPDNDRDGIFAAVLVIDVQDQADGSKTGAFNFVLNMA